MLPKLTALQSRLLVSAISLIIIIALYHSIASRTLAEAFDVDSVLNDLLQFRNPSLQFAYSDDESLDTLEDDLESVGGLVAEDAADDGLEKRQGQLWGLANNVPFLDNVVQGVTVYYHFSNESLWGEPASKGEGLPSPGLSRARVAQVEDDEDVDEITSKTAKESTTSTQSTDLDVETFYPIATRTLYITLNTCLQPSNPKDLKGTMGPPPQLTMYVSQNNTKPGPGQPAGTQEIIQAQHGFAEIAFQASKDVYIAVSAPNTTDYEGPYSVELAASIDAPFHSYVGGNADLFFIDSDANSALLATKNLTLEGPESSIHSEWMGLDPPYVVFASNQNDSIVSGVSHSYCGLEKYSAIAGTNGGVRTDTVKTAMTNVTLGNFPKQQFYFQGLNSSSEYYGILAMTGNSTAFGSGVVGGGGAVWQRMNFSTQADSNCVVIFGLDFCSDVNYAVPGNPNTFPNVEDLAKFYDEAAAASFANFNKSLQQIPCEIPSTGQYSLARTCDDCAKAYKSWLCSVTIPRCQDFSRTDPWLQTRNIAQPFPNTSVLSSDLLDFGDKVLYLNSSRNPEIDEVVQPGPYKEILPCQDLCYNLVQSCPAAMGFACPEPGTVGFESSYGYRPNGSVEENGQITCNYPGAAYHLSAGGMLQPVLAMILAGVLAAALVGLL